MKRNSPGCAGDVLALAARIAHPWDPADLATIDRNALVAVGEMLRGQKVSMLHVERMHGSALRGTPLAQFLDEDRSCYQRERNEYEAIRLALEADGVVPMVFKSAGLAPSFHYLSSNLDVIVRDGDAARARDRLLERGYIELLNIEEPKKFLFRRFPGEGRSFAFHLHEQVGWGVPFLDNESLWNDSRHPHDDPAIVIPGARHALCITLAHWFYEDKKLNLGNMFLTANCLHEIEGELGHAATLAAARGWEEGFWCALGVFDGAWTRIYGDAAVTGARADELASALRRFARARRRTVEGAIMGTKIPATIPFLHNKWMYYRKLLRDPHRSPTRRARDVLDTILWAVRWKLHLRPQHGLLVTISGCDGSGKTVQVDGLRDVLSACDIRHRVTWSRGASSRLMSCVLKVGKLLMHEKAIDANANGNPGAGEAGRHARRKRAVRNPVARFVFSVFYALDLSWVYCLRPRILVWWGLVVVHDRYVYDAICDFAVMTGTDARRPPLPLRWLVWWAPRPRVRVLLDVDPEEALHRKPEEGATDHLYAARIGFETLARRHKLSVVDAQRSIVEVRASLARVVLTEFYSRYATLLGALLASNPGHLNPEVSRNTR